MTTFWSILLVIWVTAAAVMVWAYATAMDEEDL